MNILVTDKKGDEHEIEFTEGDSLASTIFYSHISVEIQPFAICFFNCSCRTCHVHIEDKYAEKLPNREDSEDLMLYTATQVEKNSRLSCQIIMTNEMDGMKVAIQENW